MKNRELKEFRERRFYSQSEFSVLLGCSQPSISKAESKPENIVSNKIYRKFTEKFGRVDTSVETVPDPVVNIEISVKIKQSQLDRIKHKKAKLDLSQFFEMI